MPIFLCRWPNGDFSIVGAQDQDDAIIQLDEWANAEQAQLWPMETCMIDFRLNDSGEIELNEPGFGEEAYSEIMDRCYPKLRGVLESDTEAADEIIRAAVEHERNRVAGRKGPEADTLTGRDLQQITGAPSALVNRLVENVANEILKSPGGAHGKPN